MFRGSLDTIPSSGQRFAAELAYGFPAHDDHVTLTPALELAFSPTSRNYGLLWSVAPYAEQLQGEPWELSLTGQQQERNTTTSPVEHSLELTFSTLFLTLHHQTGTPCIALIVFRLPLTLKTYSPWG